ncbi:hypothetical protein E6H29_05540 [Candidatus Bathyarchaeota archaeon]|nr:MAG: hypothetical protein E6H29_05540 [Candidatus Bathyarchaeota archaeon]
MEVYKPTVEVLVEGELSPFEHEALYQLLKKTFSVEHPSYVELSDENLATRVNIVFHHPYTSELFNSVLQENWRDLKEILRQVRHRRGRAGAAFNLAFVNGSCRLVFSSGRLEQNAMSSAIEQVGYLTGIVQQMMRPDTMKETLGLIECSFDPKTDRWHEFRGFSLSNEKKIYAFDDSTLQWTPLSE